MFWRWWCCQGPSGMDIMWQPRKRQQGSRPPGHFLLGASSSRNFLSHFRKVPEREGSTSHHWPASSSGSLYWNSLSQQMPRELGGCSTTGCWELGPGGEGLHLHQGRSSVYLP